MAVPKSKPTKTARGNRRSHDSLKATNVRPDATSGEVGRPHHVSPDGFYNGRKIIDTKVNT